MTEAKKLVFPVRLTADQMAFLLSLVGAREVAGLGPQELVPANEAARDRVLLAGRDQLERDGWLHHTVETGRYELNRELGAVLTTVAAPDTLATTTLRAAGQPDQRVAHYLTQPDPAIVEGAFDGQAFQLAGLATVEVMLARLANTLGLPESSEPMELEMTAAEVQALVANPAPDALNGYGVPVSASASLAAALTDARQQGIVQVTHLRFGQVASTRQLRLLALDSPHPWAATPAADRRVRFTPADRHSFQAALRDMLASSPGTDHA